MHVSTLKTILVAVRDRLGGNPDYLGEPASAGGESMSEETTTPKTCEACGEAYTIQYAEHLEKECKNRPNSDKGEIRAIPAAELMAKTFPPAKWLVSRLIRRGAMNLLVAKRGDMKTHFALNMGKSVANGDKFLGDTYGFETEKNPVVFLDGENGESEIQARLKAQLNGSELPGNLEFCCFPMLKLDSDYEAFSRFFSQHRGAFVIVDTIKRFTASEENSTDAMNSFLTDVIQRLINEYELTFLFLHHLRKGMGKGQVDDWQDEARGSSELTNYSFSTLMLRKLKDGRTLVMHHLKARSGGLELEPQRIEIGGEGETLTFTNCGGYEDLASQPEKAARALKQWLYEQGIQDFKTADATAHLRKLKFNPKATSRALGLLVEDGTIQKPRKGEYSVISGKLSDFGTMGQTGQEGQGEGSNGD